MLSTFFATSSSSIFDGLFPTSESVSMFSHCLQGSSASLNMVVGNHDLTQRSIPDLMQKKFSQGLVGRCQDYNDLQATTTTAELILFEIQ